MVDGSTRTVITSLARSGAKLEQTVINVSADGRTTVTEWDLDGNGIFERRRTTIRTQGSDGCMTTTDKLEDLITNKILSEEHSRIRGDGKTQERLVDFAAFRDGIAHDHAEFTVRNDITGETVTTIDNNAEARKLEHLGVGTADWVKAIAARTIITTSADGMRTTTLYDYDGDGRFEVTAIANIQIDVCGRPGKCKQNLTSVQACGRVLTCVRPRKATSTRRGPLWNAWLGSNSARRARGTHRSVGSSDPVSDRLPIILR